MKAIHVSGILLLCLALSSCAKRAYDYSEFYAHQPRSILVVPILNETVEIMAPDLLISSVSYPLGERGYYVFPVHLTDVLLKDLGLPEAGLVQQLPPKKFYEYFGADAVLFMKIKDWSSKYIVISNTKEISVEYVLLDTRTGAVLWSHAQYIQQSSGDGGGGIVGALVNAAVDKVIAEAMESQYRPLARQVNFMAFTSTRVGLPAGPYHSKHGKDRSHYPAKK
jgi:hypothetical protein